MAFASVRAPPPVFVKDTPLITPDNVAPPEETLIVSAPKRMILLGALTLGGCKSKTVPAVIVNVLAAAPKALLLPSESVPAVKAVFPVKVLAPFNTRVPAPVFVTGLLTVLLIMPDKVPIPEATPNVSAPFIEIALKRVTPEPKSTSVEAAVVRVPVPMLPLLPTKRMPLFKLVPPL